MLLQKGVAKLENRLPKVLSPKQHAIADYITFGGFALMAGLFWNHHRRAAMSALFCASAEAINIVLTDFPGGVANVVSYDNHGRIDMGIAATCAALPNFMDFDDDPEAKFFRAMALNITTVTALTDFEAPRCHRVSARVAA